jgi:inhibitor of the pro-sigma K processing machinery
MDFGLPAQIAGLSLENAAVLAVAAIVFIGLAVFIIGILKKVLENTVLGLVALFAINLIGGSLGFSMPVNATTLIASAVFGLAGVGALILLKLAGISF